MQRFLTPTLSLYRLFSFAQKSRLIPSLAQLNLRFVLCFSKQNAINLQLLIKFHPKSRFYTFLLAKITNKGHKQKRSRGIAQLVEQRPPKPWAEGSSPSTPVQSTNLLIRAFFVFTFLIIIFLCLLFLLAKITNKGHKQKRPRGIAQLVEQRPPKPWAEGSSPSTPVQSTNLLIRAFFVFNPLQLPLPLRSFLLHSFTGKAFP